MNYAYKVSVKILEAGKIKVVEQYVSAWHYGGIVDGVVINENAVTLIDGDGKTVFTNVIAVDEDITDYFEID